MNDESFTLTQHLAAPPTAVYHAWTQPEQLQQWFRPDANHRLTRVENELRSGGDFRFDLQTASSQTHRFGGLYRRLAPPHRLIFTWHWDDEFGVDGLSEDTYIELTFAAAPDAATQLTLFHDEFLTAADLTWHQQFWQAVLASLGNYFDGA